MISLEVQRLRKSRQKMPQVLSNRVHKSSKYQNIETTVKPWPLATDHCRQWMPVEETSFHRLLMVPQAQLQRPPWSNILTWIFNTRFLSVRTLTTLDSPDKENVTNTQVVVIKPIRKHVVSTFSRWGPTLLAPPLPLILASLHCRVGTTSAPSILVHPAYYATSAPYTKNKRRRKSIKFSYEVTIQRRPVARSPETNHRYDGISTLYGIWCDRPRRIDFEPVKR